MVNGGYDYAQFEGDKFGLFYQNSLIKIKKFLGFWKIRIRNWRSQFVALKSSQLMFRSHFGRFQNWWHGNQYWDLTNSQSQL
jgi:hypothetical protein